MSKSVQKLNKTELETLLEIDSTKLNTKEFNVLINRIVQLTTNTKATDLEQYRAARMNEIVYDPKDYKKA